MKKTICAFAVAATIALAVTNFFIINKAKGEPAPKLTVGQVINIFTGLSQLDGYQSGVDKDGKPVTVPYKFSGTTRMAIALNLESGRSEFLAFQTATNALISQLSAGATKVPEDKLADFNAENAQMLAAPARAVLVKIKATDLNLEQNPIPGSTLSLIIPIVER